MKIRKSILFLTLTIGLIFSAYAQDYKKTVVTDPAISRRCDALMKQRYEKIDHKQKITGLLERNKRLTQELRHTLNQIQNREENIIRKGCPGITL
jgi:hypothetical protein